MTTKSHERSSLRAVVPTAARLRAVREAALDRSYVSMGSRRTQSVHEFYRYPARFSPDFVRSVISAFTRRGDLVLDPFVGGGTTLVEARLLSRLAVGSDLNALAIFVSKAKTELHTAESLRAVRSWAEQVEQKLRLDSPASWAHHWEDAGYLRHLDSPDTWRIRNLLALALRDRPWSSESAELLARCAILRTGQWALDMRQEVPTVAEFRDKLAESVRAMASVAGKYRDAVKVADKRVPTVEIPRTLILHRGVPGLADRHEVAAHAAPRLIVTSPPYPGVYVNYHRWKVNGRKETPAPFWVAGCLDGRGMSHYTMGAKVDKTLDTYFGRLEQAWTELAGLVGKSTWIVQMVGFHEPRRQLPRYLRVMNQAGFREVRFPDLATARDGRLWREVPGRRWWVLAGALDTAAPHTSREVVLIHRLDH